MLTSSYKKSLEAVGFVNPDGEKVLVVLNNSELAEVFEVYDGANCCQLSIEPNAIITVCW